MKFQPNKYYRLRNGHKATIEFSGQYLLHVHDLTTGKFYQNELHASSGMAFAVDPEMKNPRLHPCDIVGVWTNLVPGKTYRTRDGKHEVTVRHNDTVSVWPLNPLEGDVWLGGKLYTVSYRADGTQDSTEEHPLDLMPSPEPIYTWKTGPGGKCNLYRNGIWVGKFQNEAATKAYAEFLKKN